MPIRPDRSVPTAMTMFGAYTTPLVTRYASPEMSQLFSPLSYARAWRQVWIALAEAQQQCGALITKEQIEALKQTQDEIDFARVADLEAETRHDVMAHLKAWGEICPLGRPILHLGATSQFVNDNAEALMFRQALVLIRNRLINVIRVLTTFAQAERDQPTLGYTHFQPAQLVTVGKRVSVWIDDLILDLQDLVQRSEEIPCRGAKGTVGTQASYFEILGSAKKVIEMDQLVAEKLQFPRSSPITGQTLSRKYDTRILDALASLATTLSKFGRDMRLLMHTGELREPFRKNQVGSSAMPYKRNPILAERICALARLVMHQRNCIAEMAASQWLERSLDDSATRRVTIPEAFLATDGLLRVVFELASGLTVDRARIQQRIDRHLPFLAVEAILAEASKVDLDRQEAHEKLRQHALALYGNPKLSFLKRLESDEFFKPLKKTLPKLLDPPRLTGLAGLQVENFLRETVRPVLERFANVPGLPMALQV